MTDTTTPDRVTAALGAYEASSLLNTYASLPQPGYLTVCPFDSGRAQVTYQMDTADHVRAWATQFGTEPRVSELSAEDRPRPGTLTETSFPHPFNAAITVAVTNITYHG